MLIRFESCPDYKTNNYGKRNGGIININDIFLFNGYIILAEGDSNYFKKNTKQITMAQQTEFIPYEQALELMNLGFDEPYYFATYLDSSNLIPREEEDGWNLSKGIIAPLYQQAFRWFRDKKLSDCCICRYQSRDDGGVYYYYIINHDFGIEQTTHFKEGFCTYEESELACLKKLIEIVKNK